MPQNKRLNRSLFSKYRDSSLEVLQLQLRLHPQLNCPGILYVTDLERKALFNSVRNTR
jgi:hypothetical protein